MSYTKAVIEMLKDYRGKETIAFKKIAYQKAITNLKDIDIYRIDDVKDIPGIGKSILTKIQKVLDTHVPEPVIEGRNKFELTDIYGIGEETAKKLIGKGIDTLDKLRENKDILNKSQKKGLEYYEDLMERIPRDEMIEHERYIKSRVKDIKDLEITITGSYRRGKESSGDIDVLVKGEREHDDSMLSKIVERLGNNYVKEILAMKSKKFLGICKLGDSKNRRLDIIFTPPDEYPYAILYFTGSKDHNVIMRKKARILGYTLNEHGMKKIKKDVKDVPIMKSEKDIFDFLEIEYKDPIDR